MSNIQSATGLFENQKTADIGIQCAHYLMEMMEPSILRSHAFLTLIDRDRLQLMYADRSLMVITSIISLTSTEGEDMFLAMFIAFHYLTPKQWGFLPLVGNSFALKSSVNTAYYHQSGSITGKLDCLKNLDLHLQKKKVGERTLRLVLQDIIYHQPGIIGRVTCVVAAHCEDLSEWKKRELVVKVSWPNKSRESEISLLECARKKGEELVERRKADQIKLKAEVETLRATGQTEEATRKSKIVDSLVEESGKHWALNHLPNILYSEDYDLESEREPMPQTKLHLFFSTAEFINGKFDYKPRVL